MLLIRNYTKWYQGKELLDQSKMVRFGDGISTTFLKSQGLDANLNPLSQDQARPTNKVK